MSNNNAELVVKKIGGTKYAYITTSAGGDKIYCNISVDKNFVKTYSILVANKMLGIGDPISFSFNKRILQREVAKLCDCGINIDSKTMSRVFSFLLKWESGIPTVSNIEEFSFENALKELKDFCDNQEDFVTDEYVCIPTDSFAEFADSVGTTQSDFKKALKRCGILKPNRSQRYRYRVNITDKKFIWTYRIDREQLAKKIEDGERLLDEK